MTNDTLLTPAPLAIETPGARMVRQFIEANGFYLLSALLMILGCFLLMRTGVVPGQEVRQALQPFLILQGYEVLVIVTAAAIVRRFSRLGDAMTLLAIELTLLLDPTFFSNALFTLQRPEAAALNLLCFALAPVKLLILLTALRLTLTRGMWLAFIVAAAIVYMGEWPLSLDTLPISHAIYLYSLAWGLVLLAALLPAKGPLFHTRTSNPDHISAKQSRILSTLLFALPLFTVTTHWLESLHVHQSPTYPFYAAPLLLAAAVLLLKRMPRENFSNRLLAIDFLSIAALVASLRTASLEGKIVHHAATELPAAFVQGRIALVVAAIAVALVYLSIALKLRSRLPLIRIAALITVAAVDVLIRWGIVAGAAHHIASGLNLLNSFVWSHETLILAWIAFFAAALAIRHPREWTCQLPGTLLIVSAYSADLQWLPPMIQVLLLHFLIVDQIFRPTIEHGNRVLLAGIVAFMGLLSFQEDPALKTGAVVMVEVLLAMLTAFTYRQIAFGLLALVEGTALIVSAFAASDVVLPIGVVVVAGGLILFALGVTLSFHKETLLRRFTPSEPPTEF